MIHEKEVKDNEREARFMDDILSAEDFIDLWDVCYEYVVEYDEGVFRGNGIEVTFKQLAEHK